MTNDIGVRHDLLIVLATGIFLIRLDDTFTAKVLTILGSSVEWITIPRCKATLLDHFGVHGAVRVPHSNRSGAIVRREFEAVVPVGLQGFLTSDRDNGAILIKNS